ncbi:LOW QUALITY PROTEIN: hypothetical protein BC936DRAFT_140592 [Jimgerdemannia flammicorona]|uniref:Uncharacterized protein n=1 Tax=Jimgerdemannia flammicorona TaxID=994334 RepID=A0A433DMU1_9FUNG|nr:LOW QUALITY PROTEIN: hypothetical protein BC936DRAFT_140592 [Jimgerdemannia flammicorona]
MLFILPFGMVSAQEFSDLHLTENLRAAVKVLEDTSGIYCIKCQAQCILGVLCDWETDLKNILSIALMYIYGVLLKNMALGAHFTFIIVEFVEFLSDLSLEENKANLLAREQHWLDWLFSQPASSRYNFSPTAGSPLGVTRSEETKA